LVKVFDETKRRGVLIGKGGLYGNVMRIGPPLIASKSDIDELVSAIDAPASSYFVRAKSCSGILRDARG
jgi:4-aminobutyrate aminotransferase-like enzyme